MDELILTDAQCDRLINMVMNKLALKNGLDINDLEADIRKHPSLGRSIVQTACMLGVVQAGAQSVQRVFVVVKTYNPKNTSTSKLGAQLIVSGHATRELAESAAKLDEDRYHDIYYGYRQYGAVPMYLWEIVELVMDSTPGQAGAQQAPIQEPVGMLRMGARQKFNTTKAAEALDDGVWHPVYTAPVQAGAQAVQQPFGYVSEHNCQGPFQFQFHKESATVYTDNCKSITAVYAAPVQAQAQNVSSQYTAADVSEAHTAGYRLGLSQAQERKPLESSAIHNVIDEAGLNNYDRDDTHDLAIARAIEAKIKIKEQP